MKQFFLFTLVMCAMLVLAIPVEGSPPVRAQQSTPTATASTRSVLYPVSRNGKQGYIDRTGKIVVLLIYDTAYFFGQDETADILLNGKYGLINRAGEVI